MINNNDLLKEVSIKELKELSDFEGTGELNQEIIDDSLNDALALIGSFIKLPSNPTQLLKDICVDLTIIELKKRNNFPKERLKEQMKRCEELLLKMANKKIPIDLEDKSEPKTVSRSFKHDSKKMDLRGLNG